MTDFDPAVSIILSLRDPTVVNSGRATLRRSKDVVVFTGAGISAESGIATFRDDDGWPDRHWSGRGATR